MSKHVLVFGATLLVFFAGYAGVSYFNSSDEKPIVIVIPSYNNKDWYKKNLDSVFNQKYNNYRVIYIDDASTDGTADLVEQYVNEKGQTHRVTLIKNKTNKGAMANHRTAVYQCRDHEIVADLDGDDWFKHEEVLLRVNEEYKKPNVWMTYGQYEMDPAEYPGICRKLPSWVSERNAYRQIPWVTSHLRTFYAGLFKKIKKEDLMYQGKFFPVTCDVAMMLPMLEMAGSHVSFIPDILYVYNCHNELNDYKQRLDLQLHLNKYIRSKPRYTQLASL